jgi:hypothetical protein
MSPAEKRVKSTSQEEREEYVVKLRRRRSGIVQRVEQESLLTGALKSKQLAAAAKEHTDS